MAVTRSSLVRIGIFLFVFVLSVGLSALLSTWFVVRQLSAAVQQQTAEPAADAAGSARDVPAVEIDFYDATGITRDQLRTFLRDFCQREQVDNYPALVTLQDHHGDYLVESRVIVRWNGGEHRLLVGKTGVVQFLLAEPMLEGLKIIAPQGYQTLRQRSVPLGSAYDPEEKLDTAELPFHVHYDGTTRTVISRELARLKDEAQGLPLADFQEQLRRRTCTLELAPPAATKMTAEEIFRRNRRAVVIVVHLMADGQQTHATGFVLDGSGVIATNYHVVDKPKAIVRGVLTADGDMFPITEVLAADKAGDVVLLKIDATDLPATSLSTADAEGAAVTLISHPNMSYYTLTQGYITRYWADTQHGRVTLRMGVTAEFAGGSSGAPLFNASGNVAGIVSSTANVGYQMVNRMAIPAHTIRQLIRAPADSDP